MKRLVLILILLVSLPAIGDTEIQNFPAAATQFIDSEMPVMEAAIAAKDRSYFTGASNRVTDFLNKWNALTPGSPILEQHPACASAVVDFVIVGLCRISP